MSKSGFVMCGNMHCVKSPVGVDGVLVSHKCTSKRWSFWSHRNKDTWCIVPCPSPPSSIAEWFGAQASAMNTLLWLFVAGKNVGSGCSVIVLVAAYRKCRQQSRMTMLARVFLAFILHRGCIVFCVKTNTHTQQNIAVMTC